MNSEPNSAAGNEAPTEAPAAAIADVSAPAVVAAVAQTVAQAAPDPVLQDAAAAPDDAAGDDAPDTVPDQLRDLPADAPLATVTPAPTPKVPEPSPAVTGTRLAALFPALFVGPDGKGTWQPIKLRIHADIQARAPGEFTKRTLGIFFSRYTTTTAYLKALANAPQRVDLDGQAAGEITEEHRQLARDEIARRQALATERRAALRPPRRERPPAREGEASQISAPDVQPDRSASPRPEARPERRPDNRPPGRPPQPPRGDAPHGDAPRPERRDARGPNPPSPQGERPPRHTERRPRHEHAAPPPRPTRQDAAAPMPRVDVAPALPADPAQRERAMLLRSFESSPLSKANFCALKRVTEATLDAALAQAQAERGAPPAASIAQRSGRNR